MGLAFLGGSRPADPPDLAPPAPTGVPKMGGPKAAPPLLAPEAPGPGGLRGREPPRKASPPELCYLAVLVASCNTQNM